MSRKILKIVGIIALIIATVITFGGALAGFSLATISGLTVSVLGVSLGISVGTLAAIGFAAYSIGNQPKIETSTQAINDYSRSLSIVSAPNNVRLVHYGQTATAGQVIFQEHFGEQGETMWIVLALSGTEVEDLISMELNDVAITLPTIDLPGNPGGAVTSGNFSGKLSVFWHDGRESSDPFTALTLASTVWAAEMRNLRGVPCVTIKATIDEDYEGRFEPVFVFRGRKIYDPRLDDTVTGGSGAHRADDPTTWAWSQNNALAAGDYLLGIEVNSVLVAGMAQATTRIDYPTIIAAANVCEESVALAGGGSEDRYTVNGTINTSTSHSENLALIVASMAGQFTFSDGLWRIYAGAFRMPQHTIDEEDMIGVPVSFTHNVGLDARVNEIRGMFADASNSYVLQAYPHIVDTDAQTSDGRILIATTDMALTTSGTMAQRIARIFLRRGRLMKRLVAQYNHTQIAVLPGDNATITYERYAINALIMQAEEWELGLLSDEAGNIGLGVNISFIEEESAIYDWSTSDEQAVSTPSRITARINGILAARTQFLGGNGRATDDRILPNTSLGGAEFTESGTALSSFDAGSDATVTIASFTRTFAGGTNVVYNSGTVTGLNFATVYHIFALDEERVGGAVTYQASTTLSTIMDDIDNVYIGDVLTVVDGATGGTGGAENPWCIALDQYLMNGARVSDIKEGDPIDILEHGGFYRHKIGTIEDAETECVKITMNCGSELVCGALTPITQPDGLCVPARLSQGSMAACDYHGIYGWQRIENVEEAGWQAVKRIHVGGQTFAAGSDPNNRIFTHNPRKE